MAATGKEPTFIAADALESSEVSSPGDTFHRARRGEVAGDLSSDENVDGYDAERMRARTALTAEEEKKLLRRIDWHLMPLCSIIFMFKNLDSDNVSPRPAKTPTYLPPAERKRRRAVLTNLP